MYTTITLVYRPRYFTGHPSLRLQVELRKLLRMQNAMKRKVYIISVLSPTPVYLKKSTHGW